MIVVIAIAAGDPWNVGASLAKHSVTKIPSSGIAAEYEVPWATGNFVTLPAATQSGKTSR
jgi:hypothetical protein